MRIAVDIRDLQIAKTGAKTYLEELCRVFPRVAPEHDFVFLQPKWKIPGNKSKFSKIINHLGFYWWKEVQLPWLAWRNKCDLIFCTDYVVPFFAHCPTIPVFYDANFWVYADQYNGLWRKLLDIFAVPAAKKSPYIVTISEFSRGQIAQYVSIPLEKLRAIPIAHKSLCDNNLSLWDSKNEVLSRYRIDPEIAYLLHVGVMEKRKNLPRLIHAFALFLENSGLKYQLVLVGQPGPKQALDDSQLIYSSIAVLKLDEYVRLVGYVPDQDLGSFYRNAMAFIFPSVQEGFGIPILEAFNYNVPVIAANSSAIPEVTGDAALLFDPLDIDDMALAMEKIAEQKSLRDELVLKGNQRAKLFSWESTAEKLVALFEEAVMKCR